MDEIRQRYLRSYWESHLALIDRMAAPYKRKGSVVLDVGCGLGRNARRLAAGAARYIGLNVDAGELALARESNPGPGFEFLPGDAMDMRMIPDAGVDLVLLIFVMEHIESPERLFREIGRTLRPGGGALLVVPNLWTGASLAIRALPPGARQALKRLLRGSDEVTDYPTFYRCNTVTALDRQAARAGLERDQLEMRSGIGYLFRFPGFYAWHRFLDTVSSWGPLRRFKGFIFVTYRKAG